MTGESRCKKCGALVLWVRMVKRDGKRGAMNPLDAVPVDGGNIARKQGTKTTAWYGRVVPEAERTGKLYVSHFSTCPHATEFRRGDSRSG